MKKALILVDIQNDFCANGSLAVKDGETIISLVNMLSEDKKYDFVVATQDFHPSNHKSFASVNHKEPFSVIKLNGLDQVMWPDHCVQGTQGAEMHPDLDMSNVVKVFPKGTNPEIDSYSGFFDNDKKSSTGMDEWLKAQGVTHVDVVGLALDYCVKATALDAKRLGFETSVIVSATKPVNMTPNGGEKAIEDLRNANINIT
ncbi:bifunctional nicotinamidase/pyrazinamidase [Methylomicrobium lacus]|uniref:bifunctional nicotinamidase/pyrazinamidase n=1 Tax=Methylomicrobium lacus TaxID=136992 RepID=UPI0035A8C4A5